MRKAGIAAGWALAAAVVWLSLTPVQPAAALQVSDKLGHLAAYGALMFWFALFYRQPRSRALCAAALVAMGIALEFVQGTLAYRSFELMDMAADTAGVMLGWAVALLVKPA